jgi:tetratricopeptide (TPR) repeat protein
VLALLAVLALPALGEPVAQDAQRLLEAARAQLAGGQYPEAIRLARQSAQAFRAPGDLKNAGNALTVAGTAETYAGDYEAALRDMESALALARQTGDKASEVTRLNNIGNIFYFQGKYGEGLATLRTAMAIVDANPAESWNAARSQLTTANIAVVYQRLGQSQLALDAYLDLRAKHGSLTLPEQAQLLTNMGALYRRLGDPFKALETYRDAEALYAEHNLRNGELGAAINRGIALALDLRHYPEALALFEQAFRSAHASGDKSLALQATLYRAETLSRMGRAKDAELGFATAAAQAAELKAGEEQWKALYGLARFDQARADHPAALIKLRSAARLIETIRGAGPATLRAGFLADKRQVYDLLIELLARAPSPEPTAVLQAMEASRSKTLSALPSPAPGQTLLEYWIGDNALALVSVARDGARVTFRDSPNLRRRLRTLQGKLSDPSEAGWRTVAAAVSADLLPAQGIERADLIVVADRELALIPFEVLPYENHLLGDLRTISYLPSASMLKTTAGPRAIVPFWNRTVLALADPAPGTGQLPGLSLATGERRQRLKAATREAELAAALVGGRSRVLYGRQATKAQLADGLHAGYPFLHLATHAFSDPADGQRSWILFAGSPQADYDYLFPAELATMNLKSLDLAVLSACDTEAGKLTEGEGPASFARVMLGAGARSVIASLWKADDASAAILMQKFYVELADGAPAGVALARARRDVARSGRHPFYWATFVLSGDPGVRAPLVVRETWVAAGLLAGVGLALIAVKTRR